MTLQHTSADTGQVTNLSYVLDIDAPYKLDPDGSPSHAAVGVSCRNAPSPDGTDGFQSLIPYRIKSRFDKTITNIGVNEFFGARTVMDAYKNLPYFNWGIPEQAARLRKYGTFADNLCEIQRPTEPLVPQPWPPQEPFSNDEVDRIEQSWFIGNAGTPGSGVKVQADTIRRFRDHAVHDPVSSPPSSQ